MDTFAATVAFSLAAFLLSWIPWLTGHRRHGKSQRLAPGPTGWPLVGSLPHLGEFPHKSLHEMSEKYGPVMYVRLGSMSALVISNAEMAKEVLHTNDHIFASRPRLEVTSVLSFGEQDMVWAPYGSHWKHVRKIVTSQLLTNSRLAKFTNTVNEEILSALHTVLEQSQQSGGKEGVNVSDVFNGMMMNIITQMMWRKRHSTIIKGSRHLSDRDFGEFVKKTMEIAGSNNVADFLPSFLKSFAMRASGMERKVAHVFKDFNSFVEDIVCEREAALLKEEKTAADEDDFLNVLLKHMIQADNPQGLSREAVKSILGDMIVAGTDTTSVTLDWILSELIKHPDMMKKVQDELMKVVGEDRLIKVSDIPRLKYLDAVVKEGLRRHIVVPLDLPHLSMADCKVGGYDVPANTTVFINLFAIHHDSAVWENPWEFNPERFLDSEKTYKGQNFDFIPFSAGRRMCPGLNLGSTVLHLTVAQFLHALRWTLPQGRGPVDVDMREAPGLSIVRATPLFVNVKPRLANQVIYSVVE